MSWPLGETGVGKMGEIPPGASHEPKSRAPGRIARGHNRVSDQGFTAASISTTGNPPPQWELLPLIESEPNVAASKQPRYVDISNPSLAVECPRCGLQTPRFLDLCQNDAYKLWPSSYAASAAFKAWRAADPARAGASRYDNEIPHHVELIVHFHATP